MQDLAKITLQESLRSMRVSDKFLALGSTMQDLANIGIYKNLAKIFASF